MKWQKDLLRDIRFNDFRDDLDWPFLDRNFVFNDSALPVLPKRPRGIPDFSELDRFFLEKKFKSIKSQCKTILEIGVSRGKGFSQTSTSIFLGNKESDCYYFGVDIEDKSYLSSVTSLVNTIQTRSENIDEVMQTIESITGKRQIDFLFIDGWHSINQVLIEWEYTKYISNDAIIGFHDTAYHPGPFFFLDAIDQNKWGVEKNLCELNALDYGIGFVTRK